MIKERITSDDILKGRFTKQVLTQQGKEIRSAQDSLMSKRGFKNVPRLPRKFSATNDKLKINLTTIHRFIDIRTRKSKKGTLRKKSHPIYNRIIFGHINNIVRELSYGYTQAVIDEMKKLEK